MANRKKREERLRKNPPPLPYKVMLMLKAKRLLGPWRTLRPGGNFGRKGLFKLACQIKTFRIKLSGKRLCEVCKYKQMFSHLADESELEFPVDNVYFTNDFCYRRYTLEEAVNELRAHYEVR